MTCRACVWHVKLCDLSSVPVLVSLKFCPDKMQESWVTVWERKRPRVSSNMLISHKCGKGLGMLQMKCLSDHLTAFEFPLFKAGIEPSGNLAFRTIRKPINQQYCTLWCSDWPGVWQGVSFMPGFHLCDVVLFRPRHGVIPVSFAGLAWICSFFRDICTSTLRS